MQGEYRGDFSRDTFDPRKHFLRVLIQQGRVTLDADANEQVSILLHYIRTLAKDLIGPAAGPDDGFRITSVATDVVDDFAIEPGRYYVDGILCELDVDVLAVESGDDHGNQGVDVRVPAWTLDGMPLDTGQYLDVTVDPPGPKQRCRIASASQGDLTIRLAGLTGKPIAVQRVVTYRSQPYFPGATGFDDGGDGTWLVYLDVWERHVTYLEDDATREVALDGPDTAARAQVVWQVKLLRVDDNAPQTEDALATVIEHRDTKGALRVRVKPATDDGEPCVVAPDARYRGVENQLYRVEIHTPGTPLGIDDEVGDDQPSPSFKVSRENSCVALRVRSWKPGATTGTTVVTLDSLGRDGRLGIAEGDRVELRSQEDVLNGSAGPLLEVTAIDRDASRVQLQGALDLDWEDGACVVLRRWDHKRGDPDDGGLQIGPDGAARLRAGTGADAWLELEDGIQIQFQPQREYRTGDYWLIPARTATGNVEWPVELAADGRPRRPDGDTIPLFVPPHGVDHHYAGLGLLSVAAQRTGFTSWRKQLSSPTTAPPNDDWPLTTAKATPRSNPPPRTGRKPRRTPRNA